MWCLRKICRKKSSISFKQGQKEFDFSASVNLINGGRLESPMTIAGRMVMEDAETTDNEISIEEAVGKGIKSRQGFENQNKEYVGSFKREEIKFKRVEDFYNIAFRILLIDDKIGEKKKACATKNYISIMGDNPIIKIKSCGNSCSGKYDCKLYTIKTLMTYKPLRDIEYHYHYWNQDGIDTYYCPTIIHDFINEENESFSIFNKEINVYSEKKEKKDNSLNINCDFALTVKKFDNVQIIGVRDVRTALVLLSKYKFDMVFCDYLLDNKNDRSDEREYVNQLFDFLSHEYRKEKGSLNFWDNFRHSVLDNRGPLGKYWIMPITGFNQTFIHDLYRNHFNLIDYRWNISNGADPITTPWQFLYHLNRFVELQLRSCVFTMEQLLTFLLYTCQDLKALENTKGGKVSFDDFQSFMGSEYSTLMQLYGNKLPIKRDAVIDGTNEDDKANKSVFATYIWNKFYANSDYVNEIELHRLMHRFYHQASVMYNDRNGIQRLNEAFENLYFFIHTNAKVKDEISKFGEGKNKSIEDGLSTLKRFVAQCTNNNSKGNMFPK